MYNQVEVVTKDVARHLEIAGWRLVWKTVNLSEKCYDLVKAMHVNSVILLNDAYCIGRSTQRTLTKVNCWRIRGRRGVFGINFRNAFGETCRRCVNDIAGVSLVVGMGGEDTRPKSPQKISKFWISLKI